jgi:hypothetical protein
MQYYQRYPVAQAKEACDVVLLHIHSGPQRSSPLSLSLVEYYCLRSCSAAQTVSSEIADRLTRVAGSGC